MLDAGEESLTVKITLMPGQKMNYHYHLKRDEQWTIISGKGRVVVDGEERSVSTGDVIRLPRECRHTLIADTLLEAIEVQLGKNLLKEDKIKE